ncbi:MAG: hypothetical protein HY886_09770 [Deltaproteobacteria bacterium]|nr:hypothetical protein [Deltaproteobacteria bacterium]
METDSGEHPPAGSDGKHDGIKAKWQSMFIKSSVRLLNGEERYVDLYAKAGVVKMDYSLTYTFSDGSGFGAAGEDKEDFTGDNGFAYGAGFSGKLGKV